MLNYLLKSNVLKMIMVQDPLDWSRSGRCFLDILDRGVIMWLMWNCDPSDTEIKSAL